LILIWGEVLKKEHGAWGEEHRAESEGQRALSEEHRVESRGRRAKS